MTLNFDEQPRDYVEESRNCRSNRDVDDAWIQGLLWGVLGVVIFLSMTSGVLYLVK